MADMTSTTMLMLSKEKQKVDVMILNIHSSNMPTFELLAQAVALDIISLSKYIFYSSIYYVYYR